MISLKKRQSDRFFNIALCSIFFIFLFIITEHNKPLKKMMSGTEHVIR